MIDYLPDDTSVIQEALNRRLQAEIADSFKRVTEMRAAGQLGALDPDPLEVVENDYDSDDLEAKQMGRPRFRDIAAERADPYRIRVLQRPGENKSASQRYLAGVPGEIVERDHPAVLYLVDLLKLWIAILAASDPNALHMLDIIMWLEGKERPDIPLFLAKGFFSDDELDARCRSCVEHGTPCISRAFMAMISGEMRGQIYHECLVCNCRPTKGCCDLRVAGYDQRHNAIPSPQRGRAQARQQREHTEALSLAASGHQGAQLLLSKLAHHSAAQHVQTLETHVKTPRKPSRLDVELAREEQRREDNLAITNAAWRRPESPPLRGTLWPKSSYLPQSRLRVWYPYPPELSTPETMRGLPVPPTAVARVANLKFGVNVAQRCPPWWVMEKLRRYGSDKGCRSLLVLDRTISCAAHLYPAVAVGEIGKRHKVSTSKTLSGIDSSGNSSAGPSSCSGHHPDASPVSTGSVMAAWSVSSASGSACGSSSHADGLLSDSGSEASSATHMEVGSSSPSLSEAAQSEAVQSQGKGKGKASQTPRGKKRRNPSSAIFTRRSSPESPTPAGPPPGLDPVLRVHADAPELPPVADDERAAAASGSEQTEYAPVGAVPASAPPALGGERHPFDRIKAKAAMSAVVRARRSADHDAITSKFDSALRRAIAMRDAAIINSSRDGAAAAQALYARTVEELTASRDRALLRLNIDVQVDIHTMLARNSDAVAPRPHDSATGAATSTTTLHSGVSTGADVEPELRCSPRTARHTGSSTSASGVCESHESSTSTIPPDAPMGASDVPSPQGASDVPSPQDASSNPEVEAPPMAPEARMRRTASALYDSDPLLPDAEDNLPISAMHDNLADSPEALTGVQTFTHGAATAPSASPRSILRLRNSPSRGLRVRFRSPSPEAGNSSPCTGAIEYGA